MDARATLAAIEKKYSRTTMWRAGGIALAVLLVCIFFAGRSDEYRSMSLLSYFGSDAAMSGTPLLSASSAASIQLDDEHLKRIVMQFGLYQGLRRNHAPDDALTHLRSELMFEQLDDHSLQILFTDDDERRSKDVTNAVAEMLQTYVVTKASPATQPLRMRTPVPPPKPVVVKTQPPEGKAHLLKELDVLRASLVALQSAKDELLEDSAKNQQKIAALEASRPAPVKPVETTPVDPSAAVRASLRQELTAERARLASLHERYTDAYPDVRDARESVEQLEAKLAGLPPAPGPVRSTPAPNLYQKQLDALTAEESKVGEQLRQNEHDISELQGRLEQVKVMLAKGANGATPVVPAPVAAAPVYTAKPAYDATAAGVISTYPFRILQRAVTSVATATYDVAVYVWCGIMLAVLIALYMAVMLLPKYDAVMKTADDVRANLPTHVPYLGDVKRMES